MDQDIVIDAQGISKQYRLGTLDHGSLWRDLRGWLGGSRDAAQSAKLAPEPGHLRGIANAPFLALDDVSFSVRRGETLGVIGRNGAGKSTLLKVLSRITTPTRGSVQIRGRVASLLEVGTGFHPELTGRENVFLNGTILGMSSAELRKRFDEIVAFAELDEFIDTPVKRYSSGMYMRLAFSVAAHLEPEILIVDEVLAVGDSKFQRKCLGKMEDVTHGGRTVLFVSHNMGAVTSLCNRCIVLQKGKLVYDGSTGTAVIQYHTSGVFTTAALDPAAAGLVIGDDQVQLVRAEVRGADGTVGAEYEIDQPITVALRYRLLQTSANRIVPNLHFLMPDGSYAFCAVPPLLEAPTPAGEYIAECRVPGGLLNEGTYFVSVAVNTYAQASHFSHFWEQGALCFNVREDLDKTAAYRYGYTGAIPGSVRPTLAWDVRQVG